LYFLISSSLVVRDRNFDARATSSAGCFWPIFPCACACISGGSSGDEFRIADPHFLFMALSGLVFKIWDKETTVERQTNRHSIASDVPHVITNGSPNNALEMRLELVCKQRAMVSQQTYIIYNVQQISLNVQQTYMKHMNDIQDWSISKLNKNKQTITEKRVLIDRQF